MPQSGRIVSRSAIGGSASVASTFFSTAAASSRKAMPRTLWRSRAQRPSSTARTKFRNTASPSPRTTASIHGASASTCGYMKVPWMPPSTVTMAGSISLAHCSVASAW